MRTTRLLWSALAISFVALTAGCGGVQTYRSEGAAQASCPDDEVVSVRWKTSGPYYVTKASNLYTFKEYQTEYACYGEMVRVGIGCGFVRHDPADGPLPASVAPYCYNVPGKPKA